MNNFAGWFLVALVSTLVSSKLSVLAALYLIDSYSITPEQVPGVQAGLSTICTFGGTALLLMIIGPLLLKAPDSDVVEESDYRGVIIGHTVRFHRHVVTRMEKRVSFYMVLGFLVPGLLFDAYFLKGWQGLCWPYLLWTHQAFYW
ncbi:hypothetical protein [Azospirillum sp. B4]|uniref:hypothetical protein n=1 Tax=Azospirillum sp. B4 TaxID=95605 RepID=UPI0005C8F067|nr:hypothetical protein [Azospirillum sp. B4]